MSAHHAVRVHRIYDAPEDDGSARVLVDRLWPRGISKQRAQLDAWCKDVAPSSELRRWYGHDPDKFDEFTRRYRTELADPAHADTLSRLRSLAASKGGLTLLTASRRYDISDATVLRDVLIERVPPSP